MDAVERFKLECAEAAMDVPLARFMDWAFDALAGLIRFDKAGWVIGTLSPLAIHAAHLRGCPAEMLDVYQAEVVAMDYTLAAAAMTPGRTVNDFDLRDAHPAAASAIDAAISAPFGLEQMLATVLPHGGASGLHHALLLWRARRFDPFADTDRRTMERCAPHMAAGWRVAQRLHLSAAAAANAPEGHALADAAGALHSFDDRFVRMLRRRWPEWGGSALPRPVADALARGADGWDGDRLRIGWARRGPLWALTAVERAADPLTPMERRVADLYAAGLTHRQTAARLGVTSASVRNHAQRAYQKLGVSSKVALARRLAGGGRDADASDARATAAADQAVHSGGGSGT